MSGLPDSFEAALADPLHGSSVLAEGVAKAFASLHDLPEAEFLKLARAVLGQRPQFALLHHLLHQLGSACFQTPGASLGTAQAAREWQSSWQRAREAIVLPDPPQDSPLQLVTWSHSGTLQNWVRRLARSHANLVVRCGRSRPGGEGELMAEELARAGIDARVEEDEVAQSLAGSSTWVAVGADALRPEEFWNKRGTGRLLELARAGGRPFLVVAESCKWCHPQWSLRLGADPGHPDAIEAIDSQSVSLFLSDCGAVRPRELIARLGTPPLYGPLAAAPSA